MSEPNEIRTDDKTVSDENETPDVSVVVPISERYDDLKKLYHLYAGELTRLNKRFEFIFIVDGNFPIASRDLMDLKEEDKPISIIKFAKNFGESTALTAGFKMARADLILTLASYIQVEPGDLGKLFVENAKGFSVVITRRYPRRDPLFNRIQSEVYHRIVGKLIDTRFHDITSGVRLMERRILSEFVIYGELHRFIPLFAVQKGLKVKEVKVAQRKEDTGLRIVKPGVYLRRFLDILTVFFLVKFTKKPLRFFGLIGSFLLIAGSLIGGYLGVLRLLGLIGLSNRPMLLFSILLMVFGIQLFSVGLVGELILFNHARDMKEYLIEEIIE